MTTKFSSVAMTIALISALSGAAVYAATVEIAGDEKTGTFDCKNGDANVVGSDNDVTLRNCRRVVVGGSDNKINLPGECQRVEILGSDNQVTTDRIHEIVLRGSDNKVTWRTPPAGKKKPKVSTLGADNSVTRAK